METLAHKAGFREARGLIFHGAALAYAICAYLLGLAGILAQALPVNLLATFLLAHAMVIAAYLVHECAHNTIFVSHAANARLGSFLTWICGAAYGRYEDIRYKHFRHHVDNDDVVWFDYEDFFRRHPRVLRIVRALEWFYIPAHELLMHLVMIFGAFVIPERKNQRLRNAIVLAIRGAAFLALIVFAPRAAFFYAIAYAMMITVLRFMDSVQHDYPYHLTLFSGEPGEHRGDRHWEQEHTFSNPHSLRFEWLNWLTLNFGYHNAHHARPVEPWYRLPDLQRRLFGAEPERFIPLGAQLRMFHRFRTARIVKWGTDDQAGPDPSGAGFLRAARRAEVHGGNAASFLTAF